MQQNLEHTLFLGFKEFLFRLVQHVHISLVMLLMMQLHNLSRYDRFQCIVVIREIRQSMLLSDNVDTALRSLDGSVNNSTVSQSIREGATASLLPRNHSLRSAAKHFSNFWVQCCKIKTTNLGLALCKTKVSLKVFFFLSLVLTVWKSTILLTLAQRSSFVGNRICGRQLREW